MVMSIKRRKIKIEPRIKFEPQQSHPRPFDMTAEKSWKKSHVKFSELKLSQQTMKLPYHVCGCGYTVHLHFSQFTDDTAC